MATMDRPKDCGEVVPDGEEGRVWRGYVLDFDLVLALVPHTEGVASKDWLRNPTTVSW